MTSKTKECSHNVKSIDPASLHNSLAENLAATSPRSREWWQALAPPTAPTAECPSCGCAPCPTPSFCRTCLAADKKAERRALPRHIPANWDDESVSLEWLWSQFNNRHSTPQSTIEAIMYCVRSREVAALREPANIERLSRCDERARTEIDQRINKKLAGGDDA